MALKEIVRDYEILIRFNADGTLGAHKQSINEIVKNGEVVAATLLPPEELTIEQVKTLLGGNE